MKKYFDLKGRDGEFKICSAIALTKTNGHIFVEAFEKVQVLKAVEGFNSITVPRITLIKPDEITSLLQPDPNEEMDLKRGMAVSIKSSGVYHKDIGVIDDVNIDDKSLIIRLVPRLGQYKKASHNLRPPQKLF